MAAAEEGGAPSRFILLEASKVSDEKLAELLEVGEGNVSVWLQMGEERDTAVDSAKLDALKAALDVGALSQEEYQTAVQRLMPDQSEAEKAKLDLLQAAYDGGALSEHDFKTAVAKLHHTLGLEVGDRVEFTDNPRSEWRSGTVTQIGTDSSRLSVYVRPDGFDTSHVWAYLRRPSDTRNEMEMLQEELQRVTEERDGYKARAERLLREGGGGGGGDRTLATRVQPLKGRYELYGFCFQLRSTVLLKVTGVSVGCRSPTPVRMTVYTSPDTTDALRSDPSRWHAVSDPAIMQQQPNEESALLELSNPVVLNPGVPVHFLVHSPDDMRAVIYHRADPDTMPEDGCLQILPGDAAQSNMVVCNSYRGFSLCGAVAYSLLGPAGLGMGLSRKGFGVEHALGAAIGLGVVGAVVRNCMRHMTPLDELDIVLQKKSLQMRRNKVGAGNRVDEELLREHRAYDHYHAKDRVCDTTGNLHRKYRIIIARTAEECSAAVEAMLASLDLHDHRNGEEPQGLPGAGDCPLAALRTHSVVGMDCEWEQGGKVATLQLSSHDTVLILQLHHIFADPALRGGRQPQHQGHAAAAPPPPGSHLNHDLIKGLVDFLGDTRIYKAGAAVGGDAKRLSRDYGLDVAHWVCVQKMVHHFGLLEGGDGAAAPPPPDADGLLPTLSSYSLAYLSREVCGVELDKERQTSMQCSAWGRHHLTRSQIYYASLDAVASREVAVELIELIEFHRRFARMFPNSAAGGGGVGVAATPDAPSPLQHDEGFTHIMRHGAPGRHPYAKHLHHLAELPMSRKAMKKPGAGGGAAEQKPDCGERKGGGEAQGISGVAKPGRRNQNRRAAFDDTLKKPLYSNCLILAPDDEPLVCTDEKKARWYVSKGRAVVVEEEPRLTIKLLFEPIGRNTTATAIENRCVVCGSEERLLKHHVVPHCYRKEFPRHRKVHQHHDVLLACKPCAVTCQAHYARLREKLERDHVVVSDLHKKERAATSALIAFMEKVWKMRGSAGEGGSVGDAACQADAQPLVYPEVEGGGSGGKNGAGGKHFLPKGRFDDLCDVVIPKMREFGLAEGGAVPAVGDLRLLLEKLQMVPASQQIVERMMEQHGREEGVTELVRTWRRCFLGAMQPRHLPPKWSVDSVHVDVRALHGLPPPPGATLANFELSEDQLVGSTGTQA